MQLPRSLASALPLKMIQGHGEWDFLAPQLRLLNQSLYLDAVKNLRFDQSIPIMSLHSND